MAEGFDAASFEFYEGIRILIPGALTIALCEGAARTFSDHGAGLGFGTFSLLVISTLVGLVFYFVDAPSKSAVFSPLQPTDTLFEWGIKPKEGMTTLNAYFVMLDTDIPPPIRARALYMGSMFRIGFEAIYLLSLGSLLVLLSPLMVPHPVHPRLHWSWIVHTPEVVTSFVAMVLTLAFAINRDRRDAKKKRRHTDIHTKRSSGVDWIVIVASLGAVAGMAFFWDGVRGYCLVVPPGALYLLWAIRYFRGYTNKDAKEMRRPIAPGHATVLLGAVDVMVLILFSSLHPTGQRHLSPLELRAWFGVLVGALILVCSRGHEKRLRGAYSTQTSWLILNKKKILESYFSVPKRQEDPTTADPSRGPSAEAEDH